VLLASLVFAANEPRYDDTMEHDALAGVWECVVVVSDGKVMNYGPRTETFQNGKFTYQTDGTRGGGSYRVDPCRRPAHLDEVYEDNPSKPLTWRHIYRIEGDTLWLAYLPRGEVRPTSFEDKGVVVSMFRRVRR
jgi:uncharacterized protein (TIGR03067 family)